MSDLDDILKGEDPTPAPEKAEEPAQQEADGQPPEPKADPEPPKGEPAEPPSAQDRIPITALLDEREKRQAAERQLAELREKKPAPDFLENPEGYIEYQKATQSQALDDLRREISVETAKAVYTDYAEVIQGFEAAAKKDPALEQAGAAIMTQALSQPSPAIFLYQQAKKHLALAEIGDPSDYKKKLEEQIRAEIAAETEGKKEEALTLPAKPNLPKSLAGTGSSKGPDTPYTGDVPLNDILKMEAPR